MNRKFASLIVTALLSLGAQAGVKVMSVDLTTSGATGSVTVKLDGRSQELPDLRVFGNTIEIVLSGASAFSGFSKTVRGAILSANALNGKAIIRAILPYPINPDSVNVSLKSHGVDVNFPRGNQAAALPALQKPVPVAPKPAVPAAASTVERKIISKDALNEDYLNKLMKESSPKKETPTAQAKDEVRIQQSAQAKAVEAPALPSKVTDNFSFAGYVVKFTVFLALVLGLFYGVVQVLKKGVFKRGKLGFLNNEKMIEVLSTTYVSPKKSLMIVRAHKQLFLVSNSESGLQFLSEMKDTTGIIKEGEKIITGSNFDTSLNFMENATGDAEPAVKLKENIQESTTYEEPKGLAKFAAAQDIVKFSDELKKKAKKLRPIEFN